MPTYDVQNEIFPPLCPFCSPLLKENKRNNMSGTYLIGLKSTRKYKCFRHLFLSKHSMVAWSVLSTFAQILQPNTISFFSPDLPRTKSTTTMFYQSLGLS